MKHPLPEQTVPPKKSDLDLLKKLHYICDRSLSLHSRIKRWSKIEHDTISYIKNWDKKEGKWIFPYKEERSPRYAIATHDIYPIIRLLKSKLSETYAKPFLLENEDKKKIRGSVLLADMLFDGQVYSGTVFTAVGEDDVLYHAHFKQFDEYSHNEIIKSLCSQIKEVVESDTKVEEHEQDETGKWKNVGNFSVERDEKSEKVMLSMHIKRRGTVFTFYPLNEL